VRVAGKKEGVDADEYVIFEDWLWMMVKQEEGGGNL